MTTTNTTVEFNRSVADICEMGDSKRYSEMTDEEIDIYISRRIAHDRESEERKQMHELAIEESAKRIELANKRAADATKAFREACGLEG